MVLVPWEKKGGEKKKKKAGTELETVLHIGGFSKRSVNRSVRSVTLCFLSCFFNIP